MAKPLISVIVPTYNRTRLLLERALPSLFCQTLQDFEVLVVGDGTEPETVAAMDAWASCSPRLRFWNLPHDRYPSDFKRRWMQIGVTAMNFGLGHVRGEWVSVLNDDDALEPDCFAQLVAFADKTGVDFVYGKSQTFKDGHLVDQLYGEWPPKDGALCQGAYLYRANLGYRYDRTAADRDVPADADLWQRMVADGVRFAFLDRVVHRYHRNYP